MGGGTGSGRVWKDGALAAGVYFLLAGATIHLASYGLEVALVWPANAFLVALMLLRPRRNWPIILGAGFLANAAANLVTRGDVQAPILFGLSNLAEVVIVALALTPGGALRATDDPKIVLRFALWAGLIAPAVSAVTGGGTAALIYGQPFVLAWRTWFIADALGLLICMPFFHALLSGEFRRYAATLAGPRRVEAGLLLGATAGLTALIFWGGSIPVLFLIELPVLVATFRLGMSGVKLIVLLVALIGTAATTAGHGPIVAMSPDPAVRAAVLQSLLAVIMLTGMPVAAALQARRHLTARLTMSERSVRLLAAQAAVLLLHFDREGVCRNAIGAAEALLDTPAAALIGRPARCIHPGGGTLLQSAIDQAETSERACILEFSGRHPAMWIEATISPTRDEEGAFAGTVVALHDISLHRDRAQAMAKIAETDGLTGLLNRTGFMDRLDELVANGGDAPFALALVDVDHFKGVNDAHGHLVGDRVLRELGRAIAAEGAHGCIGARLGGDEFVLLFPGQSATQAAAACGRVAQRLRVALVDIGEEAAVSPSISCGVAARLAGQRAGSIMLDADRALYAAKADGRNCVRVADARREEVLPTAA